MDVLKKFSKGKNRQKPTHHYMRVNIGIIRCLFVLYQISCRAECKLPFVMFGTWENELPFRLLNEVRANNTMPNKQNQRIYKIDSDEMCTLRFFPLWEAISSIFNEALVIVAWFAYSFLMWKWMMLWINYPLTWAIREIRCDFFVSQRCNIFLKSNKNRRDDNRLQKKATNLFETTQVKVLPNLMHFLKSNQWRLLTNSFHSIQKWTLKKLNVAFYCGWSGKKANEGTISTADIPFTSNVIEGKKEQFRHWMHWNIIVTENLCKLHENFRENWEKTYHFLYNKMFHDIFHLWIRAASLWVLSSLVLPMKSWKKENQHFD